MITTSEYAVSITVWVLTAAGAFFGGRAVWRRSRQKHAETPDTVTHHSDH